MYQLVFKGELSPGVDQQTARANAMALFKATIAQVERMFSGQRVVIRNNWTGRRRKNIRRYCASTAWWHHMKPWRA